MKYFLAIDKGKAYAKNRYIHIDLSRISERLVSNDNLKYLVKFTNAFNNSADLKEYLIRLGLLKEKDKMYDLEIVYYRNFKGITYVRRLAILYKEAEELLDYDVLTSTILDAMDNFNVFNLILTGLLRIDSQVIVACEYLREDMENGVYKEIIAREFKNILNRVCYRKTKNGFKLNYLNLVKTVILVMKFGVSMPRQNGQINEEVNFSEEELFHLAEMGGNTPQDIMYKKAILGKFNEEMQLKRVLEM